MEIQFPTNPSASHVLTKLRRAAASAVSADAMPASAATASAASGSTFDAALTNIYAQASNRLVNACRFSGGNLTVFGGGYRFEVASAGLGSGNLSNGRSAWTGEMSFTVNGGAKVQIGVNGAGGNYYRVMVDGRWISAAPQQYPAGSDNVVTIDLSSLSTGSHDVVFEINNGVRPREIRVLPTATITRQVPGPDNIVALFTGDSYSEGQGATGQLIAFPKVMARALGWTDARQVALGGTGYVNPGGAAGSTFSIPNQIASWPTVNADLAANGIMPTVDVVVIAGGYNDTDPTTDPASAAYQTLYGAALLSYRRVRAMCPNARVYVFGSWNGARGSADARTLNVENCIKAAYAAWGDGNAAFCPAMTATPQPFFTGTGRVGATNGSGNSDQYISGDGVHPSDAGQTYLGIGPMAQAIKRDLAA